MPQWNARSVPTVEEVRAVIGAKVRPDQIVARRAETETGRRVAMETGRHAETERELRIVNFSLVLQKSIYRSSSNFFQSRSGWPRWSVRFTIPSALIH